ncbi:stAR-related lipid transfer protein 7, mitochondrial-like [Saccoglossus kowalevskii]|uniref:StAR-related lipid transfer protein 7, mitochondrial-like n=1 Tax=Saccoglossus kowalevskii TaxID=10224 RepID=A0ABM0GQ91_SACKO|nr:PREDICTED: stAR-related lipid transfer protein 7, mitochondrial-like [Saccoglossus kowalevskii]
MVLHTVSGLSRKALLRHNLPNNHAFLTEQFIRFRLTSTSTRSPLHEKLLSLQERLKIRLQSSFCTIVRLWGLQVNSVTAQRIRRIGQLIHVHYAEQNLKSVATSFARKYFRGRRPQLYLLFSGTFFAWDREHVTDQDFDSCFGSLDEVRRLLNSIDENNNGNGCHKDTTNGNSCNGSGDNNSNIPMNKTEAWEQIIEKEHLKMWKKPVPNSPLFQYTVYGSFDDICPKAFFTVQLDIEYRKVWDKLIMKLEVIDKDPKSDSEVVHWIMHYPFPMYSREYVYVRQQKIDYKRNVMLLVSKSVNHPKVPENGKYVRVHTYSSQMVIRPHHRSFEKNGFDYVLTYYDDPRTHFPQSCVSYLTSAGIPDFVAKLHSAAKELQINGNINYRIKGMKSSNKHAESSVSNLV